MLIRAVTSMFPPLAVDSVTVAAWCGSDAAFLCKKVGIEKRHFLDASDNEVDLAIKAAKNLLLENNILPEDIGLCIFVGQIKSQAVPHSSALLQHHLRLPDNCVCFDVGLACSGYIYALEIAKCLMERREISHALLVTCDPYSKILDKRDRNTAPLFGDAATCSWLALEGNGLNINSIDLGTDGSGAVFLETPRGKRERERERERTLKMNGRAIFNFAMKRIPVSIANCLHSNGLTKKDIDYFLLHQANSFMVKSLQADMGLSEEKCPIRTANTGNTVSSSIPLLLEEFLPKLLPGQKILMSGFGAGYSWATACANYME